MGANETHLGYPYANAPIRYPRPYYHHGGYPTTGPFPPHSYPTNIGMGYGRGMHRPYSPMHYGPMMNGVPPGMFHPPMQGGLFHAPHGTSGGLQSAPPSATPNGQIHIHRPYDQRPHFDEQ